MANAVGSKPQVEDIYALGVQPREIADPGNGGAIAVIQSGYMLSVTTGAQTRTLARPTFIGQRLLLICQTDGGDNVITVSHAFNASGNTTITLNDVGDCIELVAGMGAAGVLTWNQAFTNGPGLS